jgi:hypothetical protein
VEAPVQRRPAVTVVLVPLIAVILLPVLVDIATGQLPASWNRYLWLAWPLAAVLAGVVVAAEVRRARQTPAPFPDRDLLDRAATDLAGAVASQWRAEAAMRALNQPAPIRIGWQLSRRDVSARPSAIWRSRTGSTEWAHLHTAGRFDEIADALLRLPNRQLVVLGPPGAGKSALVLMLVLDLLARRAPTEPVPVPVLLTLSGWDPAAEHLDVWLARRLGEEYPALANPAVYGEATAAGLVRSGKVFPVLDGLDELPPERQAPALAAINEAVAGGRPLVLTCRTEEYEAAVRAGGVVLASALVLEIGPVDPAAAARYLSDAGPAEDPRWQPVFDRLRADPAGPLALALSTPLMVWLTRVVYRPASTDPAELLDPDRFGEPERIEDHLLDAFLPTVYAPRATPPEVRPMRSYPPERARAWLTLLARDLRRRGVRDLAWWELHRIVPRRVSAGLAVTAVTLAGILIVAVFGIVPALAPTAAVAGLAIALAAPVGGTALAVAGPIPTPAHLVFRRPRSVRDRTRMVLGLAIGLPVAAVMVPVGGLRLGIGLLVVAVAGAGFVGLLGRPDSVGATSPPSLYRDDRRTLLALVAGGGLAGGVSGLLAGGLGVELPNWSVIGLGSALAFGGAGQMVARSRNYRSDRVGIEFAVAGVAALAGGAVGAVVGLLLGGRTGGLPSLTAGALLGGLALGLLAGLTLTATGWFGFTRAYLAVHGRLPWRLLEFLQDAQRRGVLRQVGGVYQFRHARLQDRLVS